MMTDAELDATWRNPEWRKAQLTCEGHTAKYDDSNGDLLDEFVCTCGWKSGPYYDGSLWAEKDAQQHIKKMANPEWPVPGVKR